MRDEGEEGSETHGQAEPPSRQETDAYSESDEQSAIMWPKVLRRREKTNRRERKQATPNDRGERNARG